MRTVYTVPCLIVLNRRFVSSLQQLINKTQQTGWGRAQRNAVLWWTGPAKLGSCNDFTRDGVGPGVYTLTHSKMHPALPSHVMWVGYLVTIFKTNSLDMGFSQYSICNAERSLIVYGIGVVQFSQSD